MKHMLGIILVDSTAVRKEPQLDSAVLFTRQAGSMGEVVVRSQPFYADSAGDTAHWYMMDFEGKRGWVFGARIGLSAFNYQKTVYAMVARPKEFAGVGETYEHEEDAFVLTEFTGIVFDLNRNKIVQRFRLPDSTDWMKFSIDTAFYSEPVLAIRHTYNNYSKQPPFYHGCRLYRLDSLGRLGDLAFGWFEVIGKLGGRYARLTGNKREGDTIQLTYDIYERYRQPDQEVHTHTLSYAVGRPAANVLGVASEDDPAITAAGLDSMFVDIVDSYRFVFRPDSGKARR